MTNPNANIGTPGPTAPNTTGIGGALGGESYEAPRFADDPVEYVQIDPTKPPAQKTLVYAPDVQILIARGNKQYDVSKDIVAVSVQRNENAVSTLVFKLANRADGNKLRYGQLFERMDRVICKMKRVSWWQVFSGYLDRVPHVQLYPGTVTFTASCTLKRILHTWWDPGLDASTRIFDQPGRHLNEEANGENSTDAGLGSTLRNFLVEVGGWNPQNVHIQKFPETYFKFLMDTQLKKVSPGIDHNEKEFRKLLLGDDISLATWDQANRETNVNEGAFSGTIQTQPGRMGEVIRCVDDMGMGPDSMAINASQGLGTAASHGTDNKDQQAWREQQEVGRNWEEEGKISDAAIHCFMCIEAESSWTMYANNSVPTSLNFPHEAVGSDGTSVGLYQQTEGNGWGTVKQRMNVRTSTEMFLKKLNALNWRNMDRATAVQAVQGSAFSDGSNYKTHEQNAIQEVRSLRSNQLPGTGGSPATGDVKTGALGGEGNAIPPVAAGAASTVVNKVASTATGSPSPGGVAANVADRPRFDTQGAISYARAQMGKPYEWGATGPNTFDCSGLIQAAYRSIEIELPRVTNDQLAACDSIVAQNAKPGDLIFPNGVDHVVMVTDVPGMVIHAPHTGSFVQEVPFAAAGVDPTSDPVAHVRGTEWGGPGLAAFNPFPVMEGNAPGTVTNGLNGNARATESKEPIARNLFTYMFIAPAPGISYLFGGAEGEEEKAFMNDQSMMPTVISMATAGLRKFASAPNGDFTAYYPDYFGIDGKKAVLKLEDIEMKNVQIDLNDDALCTHAYVAGSQGIQASTMGVWGWIMSKGFATVENEMLFRRMTVHAPYVPGEQMKSGKAIMRKFGVRPLIQEMTMLRSGPMEFLAAVQLFMEAWAEQYSTQVELTFMPELMPGNRIELSGHNLSVYVSQVTHSGDWENGFSTTATICAPSLSSFSQIVNEMISTGDEDNRAWDDFLGNAAGWMP